MGLLNEAWCSPLNPIENYISLIKRHYYKIKIRIGANPIYNDDGKNVNEVNLEFLIHAAFSAYTDHDCAKTVDKCMTMLKSRLSYYGYGLD